MKKSVIILIASAVCLFSQLGITEASKEPNRTQLIIEGVVRCDPCNTTFESNHSYPLPGAQVQLRCSDEKSEELTLLYPAKTNSSGHYHFKLIEEEHKNENCFVNLLSSPTKDCNINKGQSAGILGSAHYNSTPGFYQPNPLLFYTKNISSQCEPPDVFSK